MIVFSRIAHWLVKLSVATAMAACVQAEELPDDPSPLFEYRFTSPAVISQCIPRLIIDETAFQHAFEKQRPKRQLMRRLVDERRLDSGAIQATHGQVTENPDQWRDGDLVLS